jgi:hypothetical protein
MLCFSISESLQKEANMKIIHIALIAALSVQAFAEDADLRAYQKICDYIKIDERAALRRTFEDLDLNIRKEYTDVKCNKQFLLHYAVSNGAIEVSTMLSKTAGKAALEQKDSNGQTALELATKLQAGANAANKGRYDTIVDVLTK